MSTYDRIYAKGEQQGIEKGIKTRNISIVLNAFDNGLTISLIANISGLPESEVQKILRENGR
jgi:predicted transposase/invertase (TIGR01784 family)